MSPTSASDPLSPLPSTAPHFTPLVSRIVNAFQAFPPPFTAVTEPEEKSLKTRNVAFWFPAERTAQPNPQLRPAKRADVPKNVHDRPPSRPAATEATTRTNRPGNTPHRPTSALHLGGDDTDHRTGETHPARTPRTETPGRKQTRVRRGAPRKPGATQSKFERVFTSPAHRGTEVVELAPHGKRTFEFRLTDRTAPFAGNRGSQGYRRPRRRPRTRSTVNRSRMTAAAGVPDSRARTRPRTRSTISGNTVDTGSRQAADRAGPCQDAHHSGTGWSPDLHSTAVRSEPHVRGRGRASRSPSRAWQVPGATPLNHCGAGLPCCRPVVSGCPGSLSDD